MSSPCVPCFGCLTLARNWSSKSACCRRAPPDQGRLAVIHAPAGDESQQLFRSCSASHWVTSAGAFKSTPLLLLLHARRARVAVDRPALTFLTSSSPASRDNSLPCRLCSRPHRSADNSQAFGTAPAASAAAPVQRNAIRSSTSNVRPSRSTTGRSSRSRAAQSRSSRAYVLPHVQLGPVGQREDADASPLCLLDVVQRQPFRPLPLRIPAMVPVHGS